VKFRILGPLEVLSGEQPLAVPRAQHRALLLALLLSPNEVVSTDRLIDALWGESPPATAMTALQGHVSQLRKLLPPERLVTRSPGYLLRVEPGELDTDRFETLRRQGRAALDGGRPEDAVAELRQAVALWRGAPLADVAYLAFAAGDIARLEEQLAETIEERIHAELSLGLAAELVGELEGLVRSEPFRERRRAQLMLALYRAGRQADALQVFQDGRRRLVDELGIAPGPELQELQRKILAQDPSLRAPERRPAAREPVRESRRTATVLAVGIVLETTDPEVFRSSCERALEAIRLTAIRHGGMVERELGDLCVCVFGAAAAQEDAPVRAVRTALELRNSLQIRAGAATGELFVGQSGAIGVPVADAQRLQLVAAAGEILLDRASARLVGDAVETAPAGDAFRVLEIDEDVRPGVPRRLDSPLVGRADELQSLLAAFERTVATRATQIVTLLGPAGVGKTRLTAELAEQTADRALVLRGRCLSYGEGITFWPVRELVRNAVGALQKDPTETVVAKIEELLGPGPDSAQLVGLLGVGEPPASSAELHRAVRSLLELRARERPLMVVLDDLEHAEPALLDLVEYIVDLSRDVPLLVVCLSRPELLELRPGWMGSRSHATTIVLDTLNADEGGALIQNLLGGELLAAPVAERFVAAADGNPLFLEQLLSMLIDDGLLERGGDGRWVPADGLAEVPVPQSVQLLVAGRLDRLAAAELVVLECAAVEGTVFHGDWIRAAAEDRERDLDADTALRTLAAKELVRPTSGSTDESYRFPHLLIRDVAYAAVPKEARGRLHELFAQWVESTAGDRIPELEELLGHHLEQAYRLRADVGEPDETLARRAAERLHHAGRRAHARGDFNAAAGLLARADDLYQAAGDRHFELLHARGASLRLAGKLAEAQAVLDRGLEAATALGDSRLEAHLLLEQCSVRLMADPTVSLAEVAATAERALRVFTDPDDDRGLAHANSLLGDVHIFRCRFGEAETVYERALVHARRAGDEQGSSRAHGKLALAAFLGPRPVESGVALCEQIRDEPDADPSARANATAVLAVLDAMRGRFDEGRAWIRECRALCEEFGLVRADGSVSGFAGCVELIAGDAAAAAAELQRGYAALRSTGETSILATTAALLAQALERQGRLDDAEALMVESEASVGSGDVVSQIYWCQARARVRAARGDATLAERLAREAVALAAESDMLAVHAAALLDLADVLDRESSEGLEALRLALELFERKGDLAGALRARSALESS
jgi:DNA-binding SARP family transcriptional activator/tetratricopeptide (TPR) repeat protein